MACPWPCPRCTLAGRPCHPVSHFFRGLLYLAIHWQLAIAACPLSFPPCVAPCRFILHAAGCTLPFVVSHAAQSILYLERWHLPDIWKRKMPFEMLLDNAAENAFGNGQWKMEYRNAMGKCHGKMPWEKAMGKCHG